MVELVMERQVELEQMDEVNGGEYGICIPLTINYLHGVAGQRVAGVFEKGHETAPRDRSANEWFDGRIMDNGFRRNDKQTGVFDEHVNEPVLRGGIVRAKTKKTRIDPYIIYTLADVEVVTM